MTKPDISKIDLLSLIGTATTLKKTANTEGGEYHGGCPFCGGKDRFYAQPNHSSGRGRWACRNCTPDSGDAIDYVMKRDSVGFLQACEVLGLALPEREPGAVADTKRAYTGLIDYANAHGISADVLKRWGWYETTYRMKDGKQRRALQFPTATGKRWRFLDGQSPHYVSEKGYVRCWYGKSRTVFQRLSEGQPLVICNGEISTIAAQHAGLAATCVTAGENGIPPELIQELHEFLGPESSTEILIAFDCDRKGRKAAQVVIDQLQSAGFMARAVDLGLGDKGDLADFCMLYAEKSVDNIKALPTVHRDNDSMQYPDADLGFRFIHVRDLHKLPAMRFLLDGFLVERGINMVYGDSGIGKSFWSLDQALRLAQDKSVLYVVGEGEAGYRQRVDAWLLHNHFSLESTEMTVSLGAPLLLDPVHLETFLAWAKPVQPILIVIDTLATSMSGDENNASDMAKYLRACRRLNQELSCATLLVHHTGKDGKGYRGSSQLKAWCDQVVKLSDDDGLIRVESEKIKDSKQAPFAYMRLLTVQVGYNEEGQVVDSAVIVQSEKVVQTKESELTNKQARVLEALALEVYHEDGATPSEIAEVVETGTGQVVKVLSKLIGLGFAEQTKPRSPYRITLDGDLKLTGLKNGNGIKSGANGINGL